MGVCEPSASRHFCRKNLLSARRRTRRRLARRRPRLVLRGGNRRRSTVVSCARISSTAARIRCACFSCSSSFYPRGELLGATSRSSSASACRRKMLKSKSSTSSRIRRSSQLISAASSSAGAWRPRLSRSRGGEEALQAAAAVEQRQ